MARGQNGTGRNETPQGCVSHHGRADRLEFPGFSRDGSDGLRLDGSMLGIGHIILMGDVISGWIVGSGNLYTKPPCRIWGKSGRFSHQSNDYRKVIRDTRDGLHVGIDPFTSCVDAFPPL